MRATIILLAALLASPFCEKKCSPLMIVDATRLEWVSGAPGGRSGVKYAIKLKIKSSDALHFTNVWMGEENVPFSLEFFSTGLDKQMQKGDSVLLVYDHINNESSPDFTSKQLPIEYKGEALVECMVNGKTRYYTVKEFRKLSPLRGE